VIVFHASSAGGAAPPIDVVLPVQFAYSLFDGTLRGSAGQERAALEWQ